MKKTLQFTLLLTTLCFQSAFAAPLDAAGAAKIMSKSGCTTCHAIDKDKIGPAFQAIGQRYAKPDATVLAYLKGEKPADYLVKKVRTGTKPKLNKNWVKSPAGKPYGLMTPNSPSKISDENLKALIDYILALK